MRILLTHHLPLDASAAGGEVRRLARTLSAAGHEVRGLIADDRRRGDETFPVRRVLCAADDPRADLRLELPDFERRSGRRAFGDLTGDELDSYRDVLRKALDDEIGTFDPHIIHAQHVWILGHLALEAGVPYVLTAWEDELAMLAHDARYVRYAQEAAENAGQIFAFSPQMQRQVHGAFGELDERTRVVSQDGAEAMSGAYEQVLHARFGDGWRR